MENVKKLISEADGYQPHLIAPEQGYRRLIESSVVTIRGPAEAAVDAVCFKLSKKTSILKHNVIKCCPRSYDTQFFLQFLYVTGSFYANLNSLLNHTACIIHNRVLKFWLLGDDLHVYWFFFLYNFRSMPYWRSWFTRLWQKLWYVLCHAKYMVSAWWLMLYFFFSVHKLYGCVINLNMPWCHVIMYINYLYILCRMLLLWK